mgnify:CR=1 FL=1
MYRKYGDDVYGNIYGSDGSLLVLVRPIVGIMSTPAEAVEGTVRYLTICFIGIPFITAYNIISSIFGGWGILRVRCILLRWHVAANIGLDYSVYWIAGLDAAGAALGTTIAQAISVVVSMVVILKRKGGKYESIDVKRKRKKRRQYIPVSSGSRKGTGKTGIEYEIFQIGSQPVRDCIGCGQCNENGCVFADDKVNEFVAKAKEADGFVFGTPVYYAHPSGRILSFLDRVFYSSGRAFAFKPAASVAVARRGGCSASFDVLNKYYGICQMPVAGSTYWNMVHGCEPEK